MILRQKPIFICLVIHNPYWILILTLDSQSLKHIATSVFAWTSHFDWRILVSLVCKYFWFQSGADKNLFELLTSAKCREVRNWVFYSYRKPPSRCSPKILLQNGLLHNHKTLLQMRRQKNVIKRWITEWTTIEKQIFSNMISIELSSNFLDSNNRYLENYACTFIRDFIFTQTEHFVNLINLDKVLFVLRSPKDHFFFLGIHLLFS